MGFIKCDGLWKNSIPTINIVQLQKKTKTSKQTNNNGHFASDNLDEAYRTGDSHKLNNKEKPLNAKSLYPLKLKTLR